MSMNSVAITTSVTTAVISTSATRDTAGVLSLADVMKWIYLTVGILGLVNNAFVMYVILRSRYLKQQPRNWLIFNRSLADFCGAIMVIAVTFRTVTPNLQGTLGWLTCTIWYSNSLLWICYVASEYILLTLTCEVYMAIVFPVSHKGVVTTRRLIVVVIIIWLGSTAFHIAYNMSTAAIINGNCFTGRIWATPSSSLAFSIFSFSVKYFVPIFVFAFCYIGMAVSLKRSKTKVESTATSEVEGGPKDGRASHFSGLKTKARRNIYYTLSYSLALHVIAWSTNQIQFLARGFGVYIDVNSLFFVIGLLTIYAGCLVNPIIYVIKYERFRQGVRTELSCLFSYFGSKRRPITDVSVISTRGSALT